MFERKILERIEWRLACIETCIRTITTNQEQLMNTIQDVEDKLDAIKAATGDYIAKRDAIDTAKDAAIADLTAKLAAGTATPADVQAGIDAAMQKADDDLALLVPPVSAAPATASTADTPAAAADAPAGTAAP